MKRLGLVAIVGAIAMFAVSGALPAAAGKPAKFPASPPITGSFNAGDVCAFQVDTAPVTSSQTVKVWSDSSGNATRIEFTGHVVIALTNHDTGKRLEFNASGPGTVYPHPDGSASAVARGPSTFALFPGDDRGPALLYIKGRATFDISPTGQISNLKVSGHVEDVCAMLAA
jgi:hypothetical protein